MDGIAGETALNCIRSMPLYPAKAVQFIEDYSSYLQFHSTLDDLKRMIYPAQQYNALKVV